MGINAAFIHQITFLRYARTVYVEFEVQSITALFLSILDVFIQV